MSFLFSNHFPKSRGKGTVFFSISKKIVKILPIRKNSVLLRAFIANNKPQYRVCMERIQTCSADVPYSVGKFVQYSVLSGKANYNAVRHKMK